VFFLYIVDHVHSLPSFVARQPHTFVKEDGTVGLQTFNGSIDGVIESFSARFPATDSELQALWEKDTPATRPE